MCRKSYGFLTQHLGQIKNGSVFGILKNSCGVTSTWHNPPEIDGYAEATRLLALTAQWANVMGTIASSEAAAAIGTVREFIA